MDTIVLYHGGCRDGFCAAWVVNKYFQSLGMDNRYEADSRVEYIPAYYGQDPPNVTGKNVIIVDFCYPLEVMSSLIAVCKSFIWLDHHKTAQPVYDWLMNTEVTGNLEHVKFQFRNDKSGAGLAWDYFFPNELRPWLVDYVEDRDLWAKKLRMSDRVNSFVACLKFNFSKWDEINDMVSLETAIQYGYTAEMKTEQYVEEVCKNVYVVDIFKDRADVGASVDVDDGWSNIPIVNICQLDCSEVLHELCKRYPESSFSLYWFKRADGLYQYGIRSIGDFDVSSVAKIFGGGGHKNAAGFQLPYLLEELR